MRYKMRVSKYGIDILWHAGLFQATQAQGAK